MANEVHVKDTDEHQTVVGQEHPAVEKQPASVSDAIESSQEVRPEGIPSAALPTPSSRLAVSIKQMSPAWRSALGLSLAFLSGFAFALFGNFQPPVNNILPILAIGLALTAGFVLSSWQALLALASLTAVGGVVGSFVSVQMSPVGSIEGLSGIAAVSLLAFVFVLFMLGPLIVLLVAGIGLGMLQGIGLRQSHALSVGQARLIRWLAALVPVMMGGFFTSQLVSMPQDAWGIFLGILYALVPATTCLLAGWLLRSWRVFVVIPIVYASVAELWTLSVVLRAEDVLYIVLPAVMMSAIGTAIGIYNARGRGHVSR